MTKKHALFGSPSGLYKIQKCPGSIANGKGLPEKPTSEYAYEGTQFHNYMEAIGPLYTADKINHKEVERILLDIPDGMSEYVIDTAERLRVLWNKFKKKHPVAYIFFELAVKYDEDIFGTSDVVFVGENKNGKTDVLVADWKFGAGVKVDAKDNLQGIAYLLCTIKTLDLKNINRAGIMIAQMRVDDEWEKNYFELDAKKLAEYEILIQRDVALAKKIYNGEAPLEGNLHAGSHCRFCKCSGHCSVQKNYVDDTFAVTATELPLEDRVRLLTTEQKVNIWKRRKDIEEMIDAVSSNLKAELEAGLTHPDVKLIQTNGRRKWKDESTVGEILEKRGMKDPYKRKPVGIGEAEKAKIKIDDLVELSVGKIEIVEASDKRPAIASASATELP